VQIVATHFQPQSKERPWQWIITAACLAANSNILWANGEYLDELREQVREQVVEIVSGAQRV